MLSRIISYVIIHIFVNKNILFIELFLPRTDFYLSFYLKYNKNLFLNLVCSYCIRLPQISTLLLKKEHRYHEPINGKKTQYFRKNLTYLTIVLLILQ